MNNTRISALIPLSIATELRKVADVEKVTQSSIITSALEYWLNRKLDVDSKALAKMTFSDLPTEEDWGKIQTQV